MHLVSGSVLISPRAGIGLSRGPIVASMKESPKRTVWKRAPDPNSRREMSRLTAEEEASVRLALEVLRAQQSTHRYSKMTA